LPIYFAYRNKIYYNYKLYTYRIITIHAPHIMFSTSVLRERKVFTKWLINCEWGIDLMLIQFM